MTLRNDKKSIPVLLMSFYPIYPMTATDNTNYLQVCPIMFEEPFASFPPPSLKPKKKERRKKIVFKYRFCSHFACLGFAASLCACCTTTCICLHGCGHTAACASANHNHLHKCTWQALCTFCDSIYQFCNMHVQEQGQEEDVSLVSPCIFPCNLKKIQSISVNTERYLPLKLEPAYAHGSLIGQS